MIFRWFCFKRNKEKKLLSDNKGSAAIEFALVSPAFFLLFIGVFEVGAVMLVKTSLETAILAVSRFGRTGSIVAGETQKETALALAGQYSFGLVDPSKLVLTVTPYSSFSDMPPLAKAPNTGTQDFGGSQQPVLYTLSYKWNFFTPLVGQYLSTDGKSLVITASAVIENEPF